MDYFKILHFHKEPFSNSPDPEIFFQSEQHVGCLQKLELSIRMRRGLNVVVGDVGTGKTTLCRQLIRMIDSDSKIKAHLILDPQFASPKEFLVTVYEMFEGKKPDSDASERQIKELIKQYLFRNGVDEERIALLIIDEGQKLPAHCLEVVREFLNYETNNFKLLQTVIFAQKEFEPQIAALKNFTDRINYFQALAPLTFRETRELIQFRLDKASDTGKSTPSFTYVALAVIYLATNGFPRKIVNLCHAIILTLIIQNRRQAGGFLAFRNAQKVFPEKARAWRQVKIGSLVGFFLVLLVTGLGAERLASLNRPESENPAPPPPASVPTKTPDTHGGAQPQPLPPVTAPSNGGMPAAIMPQDQAQTPAPVVATTPKAGATPTENAKPLPRRSPADSGPAASVPIASWSDLEILGEISARNSETLGEMIRRVYGPYSFTPANTRRVLAKNPNLKNPDRLEIGQKILFPAIPLRLTPLSDRVIWVLTGSAENLEDAYRFLQRHDTPETPMIIIPGHGEAERIEFTILLEQYYLDRETAQSAIAALPGELKTEAEIVVGLDRNRNYFQ